MKNLHQRLKISESTISTYLWCLSRRRSAYTQSRYQICFHSLRSHCSAPRNTGWSLRGSSTSPSAPNRCRGPSASGTLKGRRWRLLKEPKECAYSSTVSNDCSNAFKSSWNLYKCLKFHLKFVQMLLIPAKIRRNAFNSNWNSCKCF